VRVAFSKRMRTAWVAFRQRVRAVRQVFCQRIFQFAAGLHMAAVSLLKYLPAVSLCIQAVRMNLSVFVG